MTLFLAGCGAKGPDTTYDSVQDLAEAVGMGCPDGLGDVHMDYNDHSKAAACAYGDDGGEQVTLTWYPSSSAASKWKTAVIKDGNGKLWLFGKNWAASSFMGNGLDDLQKRLGGTRAE